MRRATAKLIATIERCEGVAAEIRARAAEMEHSIIEREYTDIVHGRPTPIVYSNACTKCGRVEKMCCSNATRGNLHLDGICVECCPHNISR